MDTIFIIDVGSNSVRLAKIKDGKTQYKLTEITRLSEELSKNGYIKSTAAKRTLDAIKKFADISAKEQGKLFIFGTEAMRKATNGKDFAEEIYLSCGVSIDIIKGEQEAVAGYYGAGGLIQNGITVIDVGGASTEIVCGNKNDIKYCNSIKTGVVQLFDSCKKDKAKLVKHIRDKLSGVKIDYFEKCICIGGTAGSVAAVDLQLETYDSLKTDGHFIPLKRLEAIADWLLSENTQTIIKTTCIDEKRADVIGGGALLLYEIAVCTGCEGIYVSESDNIEGYAILKSLC